MSKINELLERAMNSAGDIPSVDVNRIIQPVLDMVQQNGGLQQVIVQLQHSPIAEQVSSWVGAGRNKPVTPDEVADAVGEENVQSIADRAGMTVEQVRNGLAEVLPTLVSTLTPTGQMPDTQQITDVLKQVPGAEQMQTQVSELVARLTGSGK